MASRAMDVAMALVMDRGQWQCWGERMWSAQIKRIDLQCERWCGSVARPGQTARLLPYSSLAVCPGGSLL